MRRGSVVALAATVIATLALSACSSRDNQRASVSPTATPAGSPAPDAIATPASGGRTVPARYQAAYAELGSALSRFEQTLAPQPDLAAVGTVSTSLIMVNSNTGPAVLRPQVLDTAKAYLDQMSRLGARGVEIQISYPVGSKEFPNQAAYIAFYRQVVAEAHQRGIKVLIETSCIFANSPFTDIQFDFSKLTPAAYFAARSDEIVTIAREIGPDYLSIGEEPVNETVFAGIKFTPGQYIAFVNSTSAALRQERWANAGMKVGVGTGTWQLSLFQELVQQTDLDFYDIHIYPLQGDPGGLETAREMATLARAKQREALIGESWLYKLAAAEIGQTSGATAAEAFRRDAFSFWQPLEVRFIRDVLALGAEFHMPLVSFWGARFMFGQLDWTPELDALDFRGISAAINPTLNRNIAADQLNALGQAFARILAGH